MGGSSDDDCGWDDGAVDRDPGAAAAPSALEPPSAAGRAGNDDA
jgi:hypothetical protein